VPRVEVELAFSAQAPAVGPDCTIFDVLGATDYIVPAIEIIDARIEQIDKASGVTRKVFDTISDNAANAGLVLGGRPVRPMDVDLRWVSALIFRNGVIEDSGVAAAVLGHPARPCVARQQAASLWRDTGTGEIILGGSFTAPVPAKAGDSFHVDFGPLGTISVRFERLSAVDRCRATARDAGPVASTRHALHRRNRSRRVRLAVVRRRTCPNTAQTLLAQLQAVTPFPLHPIARVPIGDPVHIKQYLDIGFPRCSCPWSTARIEARAIVAASRFPPRGTRGVASATSRASGFGSDANYLKDAHDRVGIIAQIESGAALEQVESHSCGRGHRRIVRRPRRPCSLARPPRQSAPSRRAGGDRKRPACHCRRWQTGRHFRPRRRRRKASRGAGFTFISIGTDIGLLAKGAAALLDSCSA
jgi:hypothetical protein